MRNTHLVLGLAFTLALAVYLLSSVRIAHQSWFSSRPSVTEETYAVDPGRAKTPRALGMFLIREHGLRGDLVRIDTQQDRMFRFVIRRPGVSHQIQYEVGATEAMVTERRLSFIGTLLGMHFLYGFWHEDATMNLWGGVLFLTSTGLLLMGLTGIYLWFQLHEERLLGSTLLAVGLGFALVVLVGTRILG